MKDKELFIEGLAKAVLASAHYPYEKRKKPQELELENLNEEKKKRIPMLKT